MAQIAIDFGRIPVWGWIASGFIFGAQFGWIAGAMWRNWRDHRRLW